jgi:hypothetical protein
MRIGLAIFGCVLALCACTPTRPGPTAPPTAPPSQPPVPAQHVISGDAAPPAVTEPNPMLTSTGVINVTMYQLQMPFGANSRDDGFWKLVDEDVVDVPTNMNMNRNGLRVGRGRVSDWQDFLKVLDKESAMKLRETQYTAQPSFEDAQLDMSEILPEELLFIYDEHGLTMRSFNDCQNFLSTAFQWAPREPRTIRLTFCPVVKAWRTRRDYSLTDNPPSQNYLERENYYDLHWRADIKPGEFLVIGTSTETQDPNRIGSRFLTRDGPNQRFEEVLIFVGEPMATKSLKTPAPSAAKEIPTN